MCTRREQNPKADHFYMSNRLPSMLPFGLWAGRQDKTTGAESARLHPDSGIFVVALPFAPASRRTRYGIWRTCVGAIRA